jgi:hypothetical protein
MKALTNDEFAKSVLSTPSPEEPFQPTATYDPDGDCIEYLIKPDNFYAHRVDELLTVYRSENTNELVGSFIKSVKSFWKKLILQSPAFGVIVQEGPVLLSHFFVARLLQLPGRPDQKELRMVAAAYRELITHAEKDKIELPREACTA